MVTRVLASNRNILPPAGYFPPLLFPGLVMCVDLTSLYGCYQTITGTTQVAADADPVGTLYDPSRNKTSIVCGANNTARPVLGSTGVPGYLTFNGSNTFLTAIGSASSLAFMVRTGVFTMGWRARMGAGTNGVGNNVLFDHTVGTSVNAGIYVERDSGNKWYLEFTTQGGQMKYYTSTTSQVVADGFVACTLVGDGVKFYLTVGSTAEAGSAIVALSANDPIYDMVIGARANTHVAPFKGDLADFFICNQVLGDSYLAAYRAYAPSSRVLTNPSLAA